MRKGWIYAVQIVLSLVMVCALATGCGVLSSIYPADISGHVTIAEKLKQGTVIPLPPSDESEVFWIVEVTVKNNSYPEPIEASYFEGGWTAWRMIANGEIYVPRSVPGEALSIPIGETYSFMTYFVVPQDLEIGDAQIRYTGQNPYSYGNLSGDERVVAYDWYSKTVMQEAEVVPAATEIATNVQGMIVSNWTWGYDYALCIKLKPTGSVTANKVYIVELYEKGNLRDSTTVSWNQPEVNVSKERTVNFPITRAEFSAYALEDISHIFSVKMYE